MEKHDYKCVLISETDSWIPYFRNQTTNFDFRINLFSEAEFLDFLRVISSESEGKCRFVKQNTKGVLERFVWADNFLCRHSGYRRTARKSESESCDVIMRVRIKKNTVSTRKKDKLVKEFPCLVSVSGVHSHDIMAVDPLAPLPISSTAMPTNRELESHSIENSDGSILEEVLAKFRNIATPYLSEQNVTQGLQVMLKRLGRIKNSNTFASALHTFASITKPTGTARRSGGKPKGHSGVMKGRPPRTIKARPHRSTPGKYTEISPEC